MYHLQGFFVLERYGFVQCSTGLVPLFVTAGKNRHPLQSGLDTAACLASVYQISPSQNQLRSDT